MQKIEPEVRAEIIEHMNSDHPDAVLAYLHHFAGMREAESAQIIDVDDPQCLLSEITAMEQPPTKIN